MLKFNFLFLFFLFPFILLSQDWVEVPPGTSRITDNLYIDQVPVTNLMYLEFLRSADNFWSPEMHQTIKDLPKFGVTKNLQEDNKIQKGPEGFDSYLSRPSNWEEIRHPNNKYDPMVQITKREAELFCRWRTDMVMLRWATEAKTSAEREKFPEKIKYRLPTREEIEMAKIHFSERNEFEVMNENSPADLKSEEGQPKFMLYNLYEFTRDGLYGASSEKATPVLFPNENTGFRCICEVEN